VQTVEVTPHEFEHFVEDMHEGEYKQTVNVNLVPGSDWERVRKYDSAVASAKMDYHTCSMS